MNRGIGAIETEYAGHLFRSRLEARWAVCFDRLKVEWQYEPQGYYVGGMGDNAGRRYLPDFYLPRTQTWVEVKGTADAFDYQLLADCVDWGAGLPGLEDSAGTLRGLLLLGPIPQVVLDVPVHPILQHYKGGEVNGVCFTAGVVGGEDLQVFRHCFGTYDYFDSSWGNGMGQTETTIAEFFPANHCVTNVHLTHRVRDAYRAARSARFEHGQCGGVL